MHVCSPIVPRQPVTIVHQKWDRGSRFEVSRRELPVSAKELRPFDADRNGTLDRDEIVTFMRASLDGPKSKADLIKLICLSEEKAAEVTTSPTYGQPGTLKQDKQRLAFLESLEVTAIDMLISDWRDAFEIQLPKTALSGTIGKKPLPACGEAAQPGPTAIIGTGMAQGIKALADRIKAARPE